MDFSIERAQNALRRSGAFGATVVLAMAASVPSALATPEPAETVSHAPHSGCPATAQGPQASQLGTGRIPAKAQGNLRIATFNVGLVGSAPDEVTQLLSDPSNVQVQKIAETIQRLAPDVVVLTGIDVDAEGQNLAALNTNYLAVGQNNAPGIDFGHSYAGPVNSGVDSGVDLDGDGTIGGPSDALGYGSYPGQDGMMVLSQVPIQHDKVRTFNELPWEAMPGSHFEDSPYSHISEQQVVPLSSTGHWDVPIRVGGSVVHLLASSSAVPGRSQTDAARNFDENRFWADYIAETDEDETYIVDDASKRGGLNPGARFVIAGHLAADPDACATGALDGAVDHVLEADEVNDIAPTSTMRNAELAGSARDVATHTQDLSRGSIAPSAEHPGSELPVASARTDYVLPSTELTVTNSGVYWPASGQPGASLVGSSPVGSGLLGSLASEDPLTDHRLVWADIRTAP